MSKPRKMKIVDPFRGAGKTKLKLPSPKRHVIDGDTWWMDGRGEWQCEHGVGHPGIKRIESLVKGMKKGKAPVPSDEKLRSTAAVHGCDGCCGRESFRKLMVLEGLDRMP